jgi:hypothetical protein
MSRLEDLPAVDAVEDVIERIQALARHPGLSRIDAGAVMGSLGAFKFLRIKLAQKKLIADGRMLATPAGDREDASCRGN